MKIEEVLGFHPGWGVLPRPERRILCAAIIVGAREGYEGATVSAISAAAGLSRATFYQYFRDRDDCLLAAHGLLGERLFRQEVFEKEWESFGAFLRSLLALADAHRVQTSFLLLIGPGGDPNMRAAHKRLLDRFAGHLAVIPDVLCGGLSIGAIHGALAGMLLVRLLDPTSPSLAALAGPFLVWMEQYRMARPAPVRWIEIGVDLEYRPERAWQPRTMVVPAQQPESLTREARIVAATARLVAEDGYAELTVDRILAAAHVSRRAFYSSFQGKLDAFLAAQSTFVRRGMAASSAAFSLAPSWPEAVLSAGEAILTFMSNNYDLLTVATRELFAAGPVAVRRNTDVFLAYRLFLEPAFRHYPDRGYQPDLLAEAIAAAIFGIVDTQISRGDFDGLYALRPQIVFIVLAPFLGAEGALEFIDAHSKAAHAGRRSMPLHVAGPLHRA